MTFREQLLATLRAVRPVLDVPGVMVVGSQVPNLIEPGAAATLVVSRDVDVAVPVTHHSAFKQRLREVVGLHRAEEEPSVWVPDGPELMEVNFVGLDPTIREPGETYVLEDAELPLLVFGPLSLLAPAPAVEVEGLRVPVPRPAGLVLEKLLTDRSAEKGARDLLVAAGLLTLLDPDDVDDLERGYRALPADQRHSVRSSLTLLSLMTPHVGMPDPSLLRKQLAALVTRFEGMENR